MGIFRFILILPVSALTIETAVYRTVRTLRCERTGVNLPLLLDPETEKAKRGKMITLLLI
jgi:hypothetical protein